MLADTFHQLFLSALYSGLISSAVTGLVVGLVLIWFQRRSDRRQSYNAAIREIAVLKGKLKFSTAETDIIDCKSARASIPRAALSTLKLIKELPITQWLELAGRQEPVLRHLAKLQTLAARYESAAQQVDERIQITFNIDPDMAGRPDLPSYVFAQYYEQFSGELLTEYNSKNVVRAQTQAESETLSQFFRRFNDPAISGIIRGLCAERIEILKLILTIWQAASQADSTRG